MAPSDTFALSCRGLTKCYAGVTVLDHVHTLRIEYACQQLRLTDAKIVDIALDSGFGSIQWFNTVFKKAKGETPTCWRNKARLGTP